MFDLPVGTYIVYIFVRIVTWHTWDFWLMLYACDSLTWYAGSIKGSRLRKLSDQSTSTLLKRCISNDWSPRSVFLHSKMRNLTCWNVRFYSFYWFRLDTIQSLLALSVIVLARIKTILFPSDVLKAFTRCSIANYNAILDK